MILGRLGTIRLIAAFAVVGTCFNVATAQDMRVVRKPVFPTACVSLAARFPAVHGRTVLPSDESRPDTTRIQRALNKCPRGRAVVLESRGPNNAFVASPLELPGGVTLRIASGAILFASRNPRDYDLRPGSCGILTARGHGCKALINVHASDSAVMGPGTIDGRGWAKLSGHNFSWWELAQQAKVKHEDQNCPFLILATHADNFTLYRVTLKNSPMFHVDYRDGSGFTAWGVTIDTPRTARNTDGIDPSSATNVTITHCYIHDGDDDVAIKAGNDGPSSHITVTQDHFYTGHGMSIGSETNGGVSAVRVSHLLIENADNGIRIKSNSSRGGLVHDVVYSNICIRNTKNPILITPRYSFYGSARNKIPIYGNITLRHVCISGPGRITLLGYDRTHPLEIKLDGLLLSSPQEVTFSAAHARLLLGPGPVNFHPQGNDVSVMGRPQKAKASWNCASCRK